MPGRAQGSLRGGHRFKYVAQLLEDSTVAGSATEFAKTQTVETKLHPPKKKDNRGCLSAVSDKNTGE